MDLAQPSPVSTSYAESELKRVKDWQEKAKPTRVAVVWLASPNPLPCQLLIMNVFEIGVCRRLTQSGMRCGGEKGGGGSTIWWWGIKPCCQVTSN